MSPLNKPAREALDRGREVAVTAKRIAKSAAIQAAKAGASAAIIAGTLEIKKGIREAQDAPKRRRRRKVAAAIAGAAAVTVAGVAIARSRQKRRG